jgi:hypothetical protein
MRSPVYSLAMNQKTETEYQYGGGIFPKGFSLFIPWESVRIFRFRSPGVKANELEMSQWQWSLGKMGQRRKSVAKLYWNLNGVDASGNSGPA